MKKDFNPIYSENIYSKCFFRTAEVVNHTKRNDFWVILNQRVIELSDLMKTIDHIEDDEKNLAVWPLNLWLLLHIFDISANFKLFFVRFH